MGLNANTSIADFVNLFAAMMRQSRRRSSGQRLGLQQDASSDLSAQNRRAIRTSSVSAPNFQTFLDELEVALGNLSPTLSSDQFALNSSIFDVPLNETGIGNAGDSLAVAAAPQEETLALEAAQGPVAAETAAPAAPATLDRNIVIAQIDNFVTSNTGFNHGEEIAKTLKAGGGDPTLADKVDLVQFQITGSPAERATQISQALQDIITRAGNGETFDSVLIPQQNFNEDENTSQIRQLTDQLKDMNIPVVIAAGNGGPEQANMLADNDAFIIRNMNEEGVDPNSGPGNMDFEGRTTSFASANAATVIAAQHAMGANLDEIRTSISGGGVDEAVAADAEQPDTPPVAADAQSNNNAAIENNAAVAADANAPAANGNETAAADNGGGLYGGSNAASEAAADNAEPPAADNAAVAEDAASGSSCSGSD